MLQLLSFGINAFSSDDSPSGDQTNNRSLLEKTSAYGGDVAFSYQRLSLLFECISRKLSWWDVNGQSNPAHQYTYSLQGGFMIIARCFEVTARYEFCEFDKNRLLQGPLGEYCDKWTSLGCNYFLDNHHMKIQLNYIMKKEEMPAGLAEPDNDTLLVQFAYFF